MVTCVGCRRRRSQSQPRTRACCYSHALHARLQAATAAAAASSALQTGNAHKTLEKNLNDAKVALGNNVQTVAKSLSAKMESDLKSTQTAIFQMKELLSKEDAALSCRINASHAPAGWPRNQTRENGETS